MSNDAYKDIGYGDREIGFGKTPGVVVVDFQRAFTDRQFEFGNCDLVHRAVENTARVLEVARRAGVPVANCYTAYHSERDMPHWKIGPVHESFYYGHPCTEIEPKTSDPDHDFIFCKTGPSIFFNTPATTLFAKHGVDTMIVTGCMTSGCIRACISRPWAPTRRARTRSIRPRLRLSTPISATGPASAKRWVNCAARWPPEPGPAAHPPNSAQ